MKTKLIKGTMVGHPDKILEFNAALPPIGCGGNAQVYRAHAEDGTGGSEYNYIIKILKPQVRSMTTNEDDLHIWLEPNGSMYEEKCSPSSDEIIEQRKRLMLNEARLMHEFQLESVCMNISAVFEYKNTLAVAMPCTGGDTLYNEGTHIIKTNDDMIAAVRDIKQVTDRISVLHSHGRLHMDISPDNIFRRADGALTLLDFGSVCDANLPTGIYSAKPGFSAPETYDMRSIGIIKKSFGFETDIYSLGAVFFFLIFGVPFDHRMPGAYFFDGVDGLPINEGSKEQLRFILNNTLKFTSTLRWNSTEKLIKELDELEKLLSGFGVSPLRIYQRSYDAYKKLVRQKNSLSDINGADDTIDIKLLSEKFDIKTAVTSDKNFQICGENGSGKTTLLFEIWRTMLEARKNNSNAQIPLYIRLGAYPENTNWRNGDAGDYFILRQICVSYYGAANLSVCSPDIISGLAEQFADGGQRSKYCILADGLDEVKPELRGILTDELERLGEMKNLRIVITSRYTELRLSSFEQYVLDGLNDSDITAHLRACGFSKAECRAAAFNRPLMKLLKYPMYLSAICKMHDTEKDVTDITRSGQLLYRYYISDSMGEIGESKRIKHIFGGHSGKAADMPEFVCKYLIPYLAFNMEYAATRRELDVMISSAFEWFYSDSFLDAEPRLADVIDLLYDPDANRLQRTRAVNSIMDIACSILCVILEQNNSFSFSNQTVKTFFAALHICNMLQTAICLNDVDIIEKVLLKGLSAELLYTAGGILSELPRELLDEALCLMRGRFDDNSALTVRNLVDLQISRNGDLNGCDLSGLNLTLCELVGISCRNACFDGARLTDEAVFGLSENIYNSAVSTSLNKIALFAGNGIMLEADPIDGGYKKTLLDSVCDMCIAARYTDDMLLTLGRCSGFLTLCAEIYSAGGELKARIPIDAPHYDPSKQYPNIAASFSPDGSMLVIANSPVFRKSPNEILLIDRISGEQSSIEFEGKIKRIRFGCGKIYILTSNGEVFRIDADNGSKNYIPQPFANFDKLLDVMVSEGRELYLVREKREILLVDGEKRKSLNLNLNSRLMKNAEFRFGDCEAPLCLCSLRGSEQCFAAHFDDTPPHMIYGSTVSLCSPNFALISRHEIAFGESKSYIGLYDILHECWVVRVKKHRGMLCGMFAQNSLMMEHGNEAAICNTESGEMRHFTLPNDVSHTWISADGNMHLTEVRTSGGLELTRHCGENEEKFSLPGELFGGERKATLSVLCVSERLEGIVVQVVGNQCRRVFRVELDSMVVSEYALCDSSPGSTQAQLMPDGSLVMLSEKRDNRKKTDVLQAAFIGKEGQPFALDVSEYRLKNSTLLMLVKDEKISLVSFEYAPSGVEWYYGNAVITAFSRKDGEFRSGDVKKISCCCPTNPRVECRYLSSEYLVMKRRYTGMDYIAVNIATGEEKALYLDSLRLDKSSFRGATGLSPERAEILAKCGAFV